MAFKAALAGVEAVQGKRIENNTVRPNYQIPDSQYAALNNARYMASQSKYPGQEETERKLDASLAQTTAAMMRATDSPTNVVRNLSSVASNNNRTIAEMDMMGAKYRRDAQRDYTSELTRMATEENKKQEWDTLQPYIQAMEKAAALKESSRQNAYDVTRTGAQLAALGYFENGTFKKGETPTTQSTTGNSTEDPQSNELDFLDFEMLNPDYYK